MQAILYALGLEGMLSSSYAIPLAHAMTHTIEDDDGLSRNVIESSVLLEIENASGDALTTQRTVKSDSVNNKLIRTWYGRKLSDPNGAYRQLDRFVRIEGAAQRSDGFHFALSKFLGWELPAVTRHQASPCPLYLECIFPLLMIEQKHGWSGIQSRMPTHFGIREPQKRALEFLLDLRQFKVEMERQKLEQRVAETKIEWTNVANEYGAVARRVGGLVRDLPRQPVADWPPAAPPQILISRDSELVSLEPVLADARRELKKLEEEEIPRVEQVSAELAESLASAESDVLRLEMVAERLAQDLEQDRTQLWALDARLEALREDLRHNKDIIRLKSLGSDLQLSMSKDACPTCGQHVHDTLLVQKSQTLSIEENVQLVDEQIGTFEAMRADAQRVIAVREARLRVVREKLDEFRGKVRSQRRALTSDGRAPSEAAIRARLHLEQRIRMLREQVEAAERLAARFAELAVVWRELAELKSEPKGLSPGDEKKLDALERSFVEQLVEYDFKSIAPSALRISRTSYRPEYEGFDLGFDLSASDMIRSIWAYLNGMLEVARVQKTKHPGLLILDEPRQQSASRVSFASFLKRASRAGEFGQQIIFATSEESSTLQPALSSLPHTLIAISGRILKPMGRTS
ncbi:MAG: hypothetical protein WKG01_29200 [Kofleriaceae bacterium]